MDKIGKPDIPILGKAFWIKYLEEDVGACEEHWDLLQSVINSLDNYEIPTDLDYDHEQFEKFCEEFNPTGYDVLWECEDCTRQRDFRARRDPALLAIRETVFGVLDEVDQILVVTDAKAYSELSREHGGTGWSREKIRKAQRGLDQIAIEEIRKLSGDRAMGPIFDVEKATEWEPPNFDGIQSLVQAHGIKTVIAQSLRFYCAKIGGSKNLGIAALLSKMEDFLTISPDFIETVRKSLFGSHGGLPDIDTELDYDSDDDNIRDLMVAFEEIFHANRSEDELFNISLEDMLIRTRASFIMLVTKYGKEKATLRYKSMLYRKFIEILYGEVVLDDSMTSSPFVAGLDKDDRKYFEENLAMMKRHRAECDIGVNPNILPQIAELLGNPERFDQIVEMLVGEFKMVFEASVIHP